MGVTVHLFHLDNNQNQCTQGGVLRYFHTYVILGVAIFKKILGVLDTPNSFLWGWVGEGEGVNKSAESKPTLQENNESTPHYPLSPGLCTPTYKCRIGLT